MAKKPTYKIHFWVSGLYAACGLSPMVTTSSVELVTCKRCKRSYEYCSHKEAEEDIRYEEEFEG